MKGPSRGFKAPISEAAKSWLQRMKQEGKCWIDNVKGGVMMTKEENLQFDALKNEIEYLKRRVSELERKNLYKEPLQLTPLKTDGDWRKIVFKGETPSMRETNLEQGNSSDDRGVGNVGGPSDDR